MVVRIWKRKKRRSLRAFCKLFVIVWNKHRAAINRRNASHLLANISTSWKKPTSPQPVNTLSVSSCKRSCHMSEWTRAVSGKRHSSLATWLKNYCMVFWVRLMKTTEIITVKKDWIWQVHWWLVCSRISSRTVTSRLPKKLSEENFMIRRRKLRNKLNSSLIQDPLQPHWELPLPLVTGVNHWQVKSLDQVSHRCLKGIPVSLPHCPIWEES